MMGRWWQVNNKKTALGKIFTAILAAGGLLCLLSGRIFIWPGTFVRGIEIGGNTPSAAIKKLASSLDYADFKITLEIPGRPAEISPAGDLGIKADLKKSVLATRRPLWSVSTRSHYPLVFEIVPGRLKDYLDSLASNVYRQPVDARLIINNDEVQLIPHINGIQLDVEKTLDLLLEEVKWGKRNGNLEAPLIKVQPAVTMETLDSYMPIVAVSTFSTMYQADTDRI